MPATLAATRGKGPFTLSESAVGIPIDAENTGPGLAEQLVVARKIADQEQAATGTRPGPTSGAAMVTASAAAAAAGIASTERSLGRGERRAGWSVRPRRRAEGSGRRTGAAASRTPTRSRPTSAGTEDIAVMAIGATGATDDPRPSAVDDAGAGSGTTAAEAPTTSGPCAEARQLADERCSIAERTRVAGQEAMDRLMATRREYDEHRRKLETAEAAADPRSVRDAKEAAQRAFRSSRGANVDTEAAARDWLHEINRINNAARDAQHVIDRERQVTRELLTRLDRLELEADAARIGAESAEEACLEARDAVARCEEAAQLGGVAAGQLMGTSGTGRPRIGPLGAGTSDTALAIGADAAPVILRLVRGDRAALERTAATLGGAGPIERRNWQHRLSNLVEAIVARAIEASFLDFPEDHRFWGPFTRSQCRDIVASLSSLGFRFDGLGGWADERVPTQRDLSLAVGYAGLDPMRIRHWPKDAEMDDLFRTGFVAADEWLPAPPAS